MKNENLKIEIEMQLSSLRFLREKRAKQAYEAEMDSFEEAFNLGMKTAYGVAIDTLEEILRKLA